MNIKKKILTIKTIKVIFDVTIIITSLALLFLLFAFVFGISNNNEIFSKGYALIEQDKNTQIRELEKYVQELSHDMVEMIADASPEEKHYLEKRIAALATKIGQTNA